MHNRYNKAWAHTYINTYKVIDTDIRAHNSIKVYVQYNETVVTLVKGTQRSGSPYSHSTPHTYMRLGIIVIYLVDRYTCTHVCILVVCTVHISCVSLKHY